MFRTLDDSFNIQSDAIRTKCMRWRVVETCSAREAYNIIIIWWITNGCIGSDEMVKS